MLDTHFWTVPCKQQNVFNAVICNFCQDPSTVKTFHLPENFRISKFIAGGWLALALACGASEGRNLLAWEENVLVLDEQMGFFFIPVLALFFFCKLTHTNKGKTWPISSHLNLTVGQWPICVQYLYLWDKKADDLLPCYYVHKPSNVCRLSKCAQCLKRKIHV